MACVESSSVPRAEPVPRSPGVLPSCETVTETVWCLVGTHSGHFHELQLVRPSALD